MANLGSQASAAGHPGESSRCSCVHDSAGLRSDLQQLSVNDIHITSSFMSVFLEGRKNDQFREGHVIPIARTDAVTCAVAWMERFLREGEHAANAPLFGKVAVIQSGSRIRDSMTHSCAREKMKIMISAVGLPAPEYCLHSLRSGGVSTALQSPRIPVRQARQHGGWRRLESMEGYVDESLESLLQVSTEPRLKLCFFLRRIQAHRHCCLTCIVFMCVEWNMRDM